MLRLPVIMAGVAPTVRMSVIKQPADDVYVILVVPAVTPEAIPVEEPMVATARVVLLHVPPAGVELSVVVLPIQADRVPPIADGRAVTETSRVAPQPVLNV
jgi:hypothetical protein